jgi:membrane associated rhomboid family serine protease
MLIIGDESRHNGRWPWVTGGLVAANILVFLLQVAIGERLTNGYSLVPKEITEFRDLTRKERVKIKVYESYRDRFGINHSDVHEEVIYINHYPGPWPIILTLITSMFLHGDAAHLIGNMWFLVVFGRNVECALNHGRFLVFYTVCGVVGGLAHIASDAHSAIPCLGASGAISGVLGAYVAIHPLNKIKIWFGWWVGVIELPALIVIGVWFLLNYLSAFILLEHPEYGDGIAYWDHLGGFTTGIAFIWGTIFYLKYQQAKAEQGGEEAAVPAGAHAALPGAPGPAAPVDPFASFVPPTAIAPGEPRKDAALERLVSAVPVPPTAIKAGEPKKKKEPVSDPFASFLPGSSSSS